MTPRRRGPRPLPMHLTLSASVLTTSPAASLAARNGLISWNSSVAPQAERLSRALHDVDADAFAAIVGAEAGRRLGSFIAGVRAYHEHPWRRSDQALDVLWRSGSTSLLDYGGPGLPLLMVPSLINRSYILDLGPGEGLCSWLRRNGARPLLLDWGEPGVTEARFDLDAYIAHRLLPALEAATAITGAAVPLLGYCMGGLIALSGALARPDRVRGLALLATPWDFHAGVLSWNAALAAVAALASRPSAPPVPVDVVQTLFASIQPGNVETKFRAFARLDPDSDRARTFVALEDWLNDGVPLAAGVAVDCLHGWYRDNLPARRTWVSLGRTIDPGTLDCPVLVALPARDRIVPPESASALADLIPQATMIEPAAGHVGMVAGRRSLAALWQPVLSWLTTLE